MPRIQSPRTSFGRILSRNKSKRILSSRKYKPEPEPEIYVENSDDEDAF